MASIYGNGNGIVAAGLQLYLDAGITKSYPGTGNTWYDISGNNRHFTGGTNTPGFVSLGGKSYFTLNGSNQDFQGTVASNQFNLDTGTNAGVTVEIGILSTTSQNTAFTWAGSDNGGNWALHAHAPEAGNVKWDTINRDNYRIETGMTINIYNSFTFIVRSDTFRAIYRNGSSIISSTSTATGWNFGTATPRIGSQASTGGTDYYTGNYYFFRLYNRGLTDAEITKNYNTDKIRLGL